MPALTRSSPFVVQHLQIEDAQKKKQDKATVTSSKFSCTDDPNPSEFELSVHFGSAKSDYLSVFFKTMGKGVTLLSHRVSVIDHEGRLLKPANKAPMGTRYSVERNSGLGTAQLLRLDLIPKNEIAILYSMEYLPQETVEENDCTIKLQSDFIDMLESAKFTDVTFVIQEEEVAAHKNVLASRSSYFEKMFDSDMQESVSNRVEVTDVQPDTFQAVLSYLYGGVMEEESFESLAELIAAADKYGLDELKKICESTLRYNLQFDNIIDALLVADTHNCTSLLRDAKVLFKRLVKILKQDKANWNKLAMRPDLLMQLLDCLTD